LQPRSNDRRNRKILFRKVGHRSAVWVSDSMRPVYFFPGEPVRKEAAE